MVPSHEMPLHLFYKFLQTRWRVLVTGDLGKNGSSADGSHWPVVPTDSIGHLLPLLNAIHGIMQQLASAVVSD